jgi:hypothetical protein
MVLEARNMNLWYADGFHASRPLLLEVEEDLIHEISEDTVHIKTDQSGVAYLCARADTYRIRQLDNSNTQVLIDSMDMSEAALVAQAPGIIQVEKVVAKTIPDFHVKECILKHSEGTNSFPYIVYDNIWSETRIRAHLISRNLYWLHNDVWEMLDEGLFFEYSDLILSTCAIIGAVNHNEFSSEEIWMSINESIEADGGNAMALELVQYLLSRLSPDDSVTFTNKGETDWPLNIGLDPTKVMIHRGKQVLFSRLKDRDNLNLDKFILDWKQALETTVLVDACLIDDETLTDHMTSVISDYAVLDADLLLKLNRRDLPIDIEKRIVELFRVKPMWKKQEFESFFEPLLNEGMKPETVLLKSCRLDQDEQEMEWVYSSKF